MKITLSIVVLPLILALGLSASAQESAASPEPSENTLPPADLETVARVTAALDRLASLAPSTPLGELSRNDRNAVEGQCEVLRDAGFTYSREQGVRVNASLGGKFLIPGGLVSTKLGGAVLCSDSTEAMNAAIAEFEAGNPPAGSGDAEEPSSPEVP